MEARTNLVLRERIIVEIIIRDDHHTIYEVYLFLDGAKGPIKKQFHPIFAAGRNDNNDGGCHGSCKSYTAMALSNKTKSGKTNGTREVHFQYAKISRIKFAKLISNKPYRISR
jgi:hypothetical protein